MSHFQHIVVGIDFSQESEAAMRSAVELALGWQARLSVLHIVDDNFTKYWQILPMPPADLEETLLQETQKRLRERMASYESTGMTYEAHVIFGKPWQEMIEYCTKENADLLVIGQRGANLLQRVLLGSSAMRLIRHSPVPLLTVHPNQKDRISRILVGVDFSDISTRAVEVAIELAKGLQAELHVVHVNEELMGELIVAENASQSKEKLDAFLANIDFQQTHHHRHMIAGTAYRELAQFATDSKCDLLVLGTVGRSGMWGFLAGNTAESVAKIMPCSLLTIKTS